MAKISLRDYNREIEQLINRGLVDEAIAHCKYILKFFPKHIDTYRLLGNAFLESQRYTEAADIFARVLSVIPDDFIAHIGMSIIREDEKNLDTAIWHMEKAYEVQPFNKPVQDELRRLLGQRDGVPPLKVRLTRGALVRMYSRGDLLDQAIGEARAAIKEDPQRIDLQVLLARLLFNNNQKLEAVEISNSIIAKLPYCLETNLILSEALTGSSRNDDAKIFAQRVTSLDPYFAYCDAQLPVSAKVPNDSVLLEHYVYEVGVEAEKVPEWTKSVGIAWKSTEEDTPTWMNEIQSKEILPTTQTSSSNPFTNTPLDESVQSNSVPSNDQSAEEQIPEWMQVAGWSQTKEETSNMDQSFPFNDPDSPQTPQEASPADIPDWLKDLAPQIPEELVLPPGDEKEDGDFHAIIISPSSQPINPNETPVISEIDNTKDTLSSKELPTSLSIPQSDQEQDNVIPDWLRDLEPTSSISQETESLSEDQLPVEAHQSGSDENLVDEASEIPDWLKDLSTEVNLPDSPESSISENQTQLPQDSLAQELPNWMQNLSTGELESEKASDSVGDENEALAWLESLATRQGVDQATLITKPEDRTDLPPAWVREDSFETQNSETTKDWHPLDDQVETDKIEPENIENISPASIEADSVAASSTVEDENEAALAWLESLAERQGADQETLITSPADRLTRPPEWISQDAETTTNLPEQPEPVQVQPIDATGQEEKSIEDMNPDEALSWLESLAARQGADPETLITPLDQRKDAPPSWVLEESSAESTQLDILKSQPELTDDSLAQGEDHFLEIPESLPQEEAVQADQVENKVQETIPSLESNDNLPAWMKELLSEPVETQKAEQVIDIPEPGISQQEIKQPADDWIPEDQAIQIGEMENQVSLSSEPVTQFNGDILLHETSTETKEATEPVQVITTAQDQVEYPESKPKIRYDEMQIFLNRGNLEDVFDNFVELIKNGENIEEIIHDLRGALLRYPVNISIWQLLGDAYFKANQLQEALDSYTKAEELLR